MITNRHTCMDKFPKFIIENDTLIFMKVTYHKEIAEDPKNVKGGGWFRYFPETNTFVFHGESHDFGKAKFEDVKKCVETGKVYSDKRMLRDVFSIHNFAYDTGSEIIPLEKRCNI